MVKKNLNPVWTKHNVLSVPVYDLKTQVLRVTVMDCDFGIGSDDPLGNTIPIHLSTYNI